MKIKDLAIYIILGLQLVVLVFSLPKKETTTNYESEAKIQELEHQKKIRDIEIEYLHRLHFVENADSTQLDSIWNVYGF